MSGEVFSLPLLQAISNWQRGGDAAQKSRRGEILERLARDLPVQFRTVGQPCFRQISLLGGDLLLMGLKYQLDERISSWTRSKRVAEEFKGGIPPQGGDYTGAIFKVHPQVKDVVINLSALFSDSGFLAAIEHHRPHIEGFERGMGRYGNEQKEVVLKYDSLPIGTLFAWGGYSSCESNLARMYFGRTPSASDMSKFRKLMEKSKIVPGAFWLNKPDRIKRVNAILSQASRLAQQRKASGPESATPLPSPSTSPTE